MSPNPIILLALALIIGSAGQTFSQDTRTINVWGSEFQVPAQGPSDLLGGNQAAAPITSVVPAHAFRGTFTGFQNDVLATGGHDDTPLRPGQWRSCPWC